MFRSLQRLLLWWLAEFHHQQLQAAFLRCRSVGVVGIRVGGLDGHLTLAVWQDLAQTLLSGVYAQVDKLDQMRIVC